MNRTTLAVAALVFLAVVSSALAGTYTVTTPLAKDPLLEGARLLSNQRADPGSPFTDVQGYVQHHCGVQLDAVIAAWAQRAPTGDTDAARRAKVFQAAFNATIAEARISICNQLGVASGDCPTSLGP